MSLRKKTFIICCIEFCVFSIIGIFMVMILFHAGILALPVIGFMWTFWGFNVFTVISGVAVKKRHRFSFAFLNLFVLSLILVLFINGSQDPKNEKVQIAAVMLSCIMAVLYFIDIISFVRTYWKPVTHEVLRFLGKNNNQQ
ncbi:MAG: hypothetical protein K6B17_02490 [Treponema sp.]|nr:hypothetical protein [Treponema sp.]